MPPIEGRLIQTWMYNRSHPDDNHYAHPIDFVPLVDLNLRKVHALDLVATHVYNVMRLLMTAMSSISAQLLSCALYASMYY